MTVSRFPRSKRAIAAILLASTVLAGGGGFLAARAVAANDANPPVSVPPAVQHAGFADLVARVKPAVVNIATTEKVDKADAPQMPGFPPGSPFEEFFRQFMEQQQRKRGPQHALGSGFIIDPAGWIVTNNHVIDKASKIVITLEDGSSFPAEVKGRDAKTDLALLKIDPKQDLPYLAFGDSDAARIGDWVIAVGNPFGLGGSVTAGILSARGRDLNNGPYDNFLQVDAPINPGNSGGPLFDQSGRVIGIDSAIYTPNGGNVGIGFAIPSNLAKTVIAQLKENGRVERGWLGVQMQPMTETLAKALGRKDSDGVIINAVVPDSPAQAAGLQQGDVITAINGTGIRQPRDLALAVANIPAGGRAELQVWRDGREKEIRVTIGSQPDDEVAAAGNPAAEGRVGMALAALTPQVRQQYGLDDQTRGVIVADVQADSHAAESGVRPGDVIVKVSGSSVTTPGEVSARIGEARKARKDAVPLLVLRHGTTYYLALEIA
ncbi:DegQ family serine endoprotease [Ferrovibrio sp.]|uniref:DegQ family serine endoprotease n=1 Tax=Ferrovibrio sp. TaxID=1917215 RepID=UPI0031204DDF